MLSQTEFALNYASTSSSMGAEFLKPALARSVFYDRVAGYFSSNLWILVQDELIQFIVAGGKLRLICSPAVSAQDLEAISKAVDSIASGKNIAKKNLESWLADSTKVEPAEIFCYLLSAGILEIKFVFMPEENMKTSIFHEKFGIFTDTDDNKVSFIGSANESFQAWHDRGNGESIEVFCSWSSSRDEERISNHKDRFSKLWGNEYANIDVFEPSAEMVKLAKEQSDNGRELFMLKAKELKTKKNITPEPSFSLMPHQAEALDNWKKNNHRGIVQFCTGAGKTFVGIAAIQINASSYLPTLVVVPSALLFEQWINEIRAHISDVTIIRVDGKNREWRDKAKFRKSMQSSSANRPVVIVSTVASLTKDLLPTYLAGPASFAVIADEVHQCGALGVRRSLASIDPERRLGLSATPERYTDEEGTAFLFAYFGNKLSPIIDIPKAIEMGRLVPYHYFPEFVNLTQEESEEWVKLSKEIASLKARSPKKYPDAKKIMEIKIHERSRIAKKAHNKTEAVKRIVQNHYEGGDRWLVYCEDKEHLDYIKNGLNGTGVPTVEYHSDLHTKTQKATLDWLSWNEGLVLSIRCLDEGVDIPEVGKALIVASSQNPRQFVQRRGRVLRTAPDKNSAVIYDVLVLPPEDQTGKYFDSLTASELLRAMEFAQFASDMASFRKLEVEIANLGIDINAIKKDDEDEVIGEDYDEE